MHRILTSSKSKCQTFFQNRTVDTLQNVICWLPYPHSKRTITVRKYPSKIFPKMLHLLRITRTCGQSQPKLPSNGRAKMIARVEKEDSYRSTEGKHLKNYVCNIAILGLWSQILKPASTNICRYLGYIK